MWRILTRSVCDLQVHQVKQRVTVKKSQAVRFEQELSHAQLTANRGIKRNMNFGQLPVSYANLIVFIGSLMERCEVVCALPVLIDSVS